MSLDVLPADVPAQYAPAMVTACSEALAEGSCALASTLPESTQPEAVALVLWQGDDFLQVTVRVGRGGGQWVARALTFSERDSISERWTTVGLTVATLVGETRALDAKPPSAPPEPPPTQPPPADATPGAKAQRAPRPGLAAPAAATPPAQHEPSIARWLGSVGGYMGPGWDGGGWQRGGWLAVTFRVPRWPFQVHAGGSYGVSSGPSVQDKDLQTRWLTVAVGAGVFGVWRGPSITGSAELELAYRRIDVDFNGRSTGDQEAPVRVRTLLSFPAESRVAGTLGMLLRLAPGNPNKSQGLSVASASISAEALAGLEVRL